MEAGIEAVTLWFEGLRVSFNFIFVLWWRNGVHANRLFTEIFFKRASSWNTGTGDIGIDSKQEGRPMRSRAIEELDLINVRPPFELQAPVFFQSLFRFLGQKWCCRAIRWGNIVVYAAQIRSRNKIGRSTCNQDFVCENQDGNRTQRFPGHNVKLGSIHVVYKTSALIDKRTWRTFDGVVEIEKHTGQPGSVVVRHVGDFSCFWQCRYESGMIVMFRGSVLDDF